MGNNSTTGMLGLWSYTNRNGSLSMTPTAHPKTPTAPPEESQTKDPSNEGEKQAVFVSCFATMTYAEGRTLFYQMEERRMHQECLGI